MRFKKLFELAKPYLEKNELGTGHTLRVLEISKKNYNKYDLEESWKDLVFSLIVLHDIGGPTKEEQYKKGPRIARVLLEKLDYNSFDINLICKCIEKHHERLDNPHDIFKILFDSDHLVMFSKEEFSNYNSKPGFKWEDIIQIFYHEDLKDTAKSLLKERFNECFKPKIGR